ncbi:hypothetical protein B296_00003077 [Ensete ventricosum]|uniref:Uncharacterized protein n=1 Tax=Ensete ventricosum TaxID=4639 RepID=A0A427A781_ENSVE|nr:hypothetical protein B296_00003077 [Ensete ventricosum]
MIVQEIHETQIIRPRPSLAMTLYLQKLCLVVCRYKLFLKCHIQLNQLWLLKQCSQISGYFYDFSKEQTIMLKVFLDDDHKSTADNHKKIESLYDTSGRYPPWPLLHLRTIPLLPPLLLPSAGTASATASSFPPFLLQQLHTLCAIFLTSLIYRRHLCSSPLFRTTTSLLPLSLQPTVATSSPSPPTSSHRCCPLPRLPLPPSTTAVPPLLFITAGPCFSPSSLLLTCRRCHPSLAAACHSSPLSLLPCCLLCFAAATAAHPCLCRWCCRPYLPRTVPPHWRTPVLQPHSHCHPYINRSCTLLFSSRTNPAIFLPTLLPPSSSPTTTTAACSRYPSSTLITAPPLASSSALLIFFPLHPPMSQPCPTVASSRSHPSPNPAAYRTLLLPLLLPRGTLLLIRIRCPLLVVSISTTVVSSL